MRKLLTAINTKIGFKLDRGAYSGKVVENVRKIRCIPGKGSCPRMANWAVLRRTQTGVAVRNCLLDAELDLTEREAKYLRLLDGNRNPFQVEGFSSCECREYYARMNDYLLLRRPGRIIDFGGNRLHTLYIPKKKYSRSMIPKILNLLLCLTFLPVFLCGLYGIYEQGVWWGQEQHFILNVLLGYLVGTCGGMFLHEAAHAIACLSNRKGLWLEAGVMIRGLVPGAYVLLDTSRIRNKLYKAQINLAGVEMNLLLSGALMILLTNTRQNSILFPWKSALLYAMVQNLFLAIVNIGFSEGLDGEHTISSILGDSIVDAAKANIQMMLLPENRKEYFAQTGLGGVVNLCNSVVILGIQLLIPLFMLGDLTLWIGDLFF